MRRCLRPLFTLSAAILIGLSLTASHPAASQVHYTVTDLGALPGMPYSGAWQQTMNESGAVAVFANSDPGNLWFNAFVGDASFLWQKGTITPLPGLPGAVDAIVFHLNNHGQMVGRSTQTLPFNHAVLWDHGQIFQLPELPGDVRSAALSINDKGEIVGYSRIGGGRRGAYWYKGKVSQLAPLPSGGTFDEGLGIRDDGVIVGFSGPSSGLIHAALWDRSGVHDLGTLGGPWGAAYQINNKNQVVGNSTAASGEVHPFLWENGVMTDLGVLAGDNDAIAVDINNHGQVVGSSDDLNGDPFTGYHALLWENGEIVSLQTRIPADSGWYLMQASAINERGQICGSGLHDGVLRAFLLTPVR